MNDVTHETFSKFQPPSAGSAKAVMRAAEIVFIGPRATTGFDAAEYDTGSREAARTFTVNTHEADWGPIEPEEYHG